MAACGMLNAAVALLVVAVLPASADLCNTMSGKSCEECLKNVSCLWCFSNNSCLDYPVKTILPSSSVCALSKARWGVCWVNFEALIITMSVVAGVLLLAMCICCYCCCCRESKSSKRARQLEKEKATREKADRVVRIEERKVERKARNDEIRKKYGLYTEDNAYTRFDN
ncbi:pituitary tumor-transforming gene 1 protein-interacting protein-like [Petromyzon marinus]|uniref:Pituitary tumor-transforming gene 1 protein-interacting protein-like n=1 Tax=Petromyzon marinus TaxID=7757 RepID=A0AAJ7WLQ4_PETMA|nr:pituitary tumor-transforming gene 1 protein-interacting protein-like [Petromyzon marinus]